jgi:ribose transport system permease protein
VSAGDVGAPGAPPGMAPGPAGANPSARMFLRRVSKGDIPLFMPYVYVIGLGLAIYAMNSNLLVGAGALDARFSLVVPLALVAFGQTLVMFTRGIDLSVGGAISVTSALLATHLNAGGGLLVLELLGIVVLAVFIGTVNGILISTARLQPFIVTLATWSIWGGVALFILKEPGGNISLSYLDFWTGQTFGVPNAVYLVIVISVVWLVFRRTPVATYLYAVGSDPEAARLTGIGIFRLRVLAYALSGGLSALAALALIGAQASGDPNIGNPFVLTSIAVVVIGGTAITGGRGGVIRTAVGACIYVMIGYLLFAANVESSFITLCTGLALLFAVAVSTLGGALAARIGRA